MYDLPKAIHFVAVHKGELLPWDSKVGLRVRWDVAHKCRDIGITDMLNLNEAEREGVAKILADANQQLHGSGVTVRLSVEHCGAVDGESLGADEVIGGTLSLQAQCETCRGEGIIFTSKQITVDRGTPREHDIAQMGIRQECPDCNFR